MKFFNILLLTFGFVGVIGGAIYWVIGQGLGERTIVSQPSAMPGVLPEKGQTTFVLRVGEVKQWNGGSIMIGSVDADSRCPINALCVWAGEVVVTLLVRMPPETSTALTIKTDGISRVAGDYAFSIVAVAPLKSSEKLSPKDYRITILAKRVQ